MKIYLVRFYYYRCIEATLQCVQGCHVAKLFRHSSFAVHSFCDAIKRFKLAVLFYIRSFHHFGMESNGNLWTPNERHLLALTLTALRQFKCIHKTQFTVNIKFYLNFFVVMLDFALYTILPFGKFTIRNFAMGKLVFELVHANVKSYTEYDNTFTHSTCSSANFIDKTQKSFCQSFENWFVVECVLCMYAVLVRLHIKHSIEIESRAKKEENIRIKSISHSPRVNDFAWVYVEKISDVCDCIVIQAKWGFFYFWIVLVVYLANMHTKVLYRIE